jgi:ribosomal protein S18 acetylase RimI-like enzyme
MDTRIRRAGAPDRAAVVACVDVAFRGFIPKIGKPPAPMLADYGALIAKGQVHVLEADGELAGVLVTEAKADHLFVDVVAVRPERRRQGLGRSLMAFAAAEARRLGLAEVRLYTHEVMVEALALYPALGYHEIGRRVEDGYARVYFGKRLPAER